MRLLIFLTLLFQSLTADVSEFSFDLYREMEGDDLIVSPFSIHSCLSMAYLGACGETADEMASVLRIDAAQDFSDYLAKIGSSFRIANSLWLGHQMAILPDYQAALRDSFCAAVQRIDFSHPQMAAETINGWISTETEGKIPRLLGPDDLSAEIRLVLANAIYFKGAWRTPFDPGKTSPATFDGSIPVQMLDQIATFPYLETASAQIAALPFRNKDLDIAFMIILPKPGVAIDLSSLLVHEWLSQLQATRLHLRLPKFTLDKRLNLAALLKTLGMNVPFSPQADFSGINGQRDLFVSSVVHQAFFALDEAGVTAAAATATGMATTSLSPRVEAQLIADRPFIFLLMDMSSEIPLFIGKLSNPCM